MTAHSSRTAARSIIHLGLVLKPPAPNLSDEGYLPLNYPPLSVTSDCVNRQLANRALARARGSHSFGHLRAR